MPDSKQMFWRYNRLAFHWAGVILFLCGIPGNKLPELTFLEWLKPDKIVHLVLFGVQCFLLIKGFTKQDRFIFLNKNAKAMAVIISAAYGCLVEIMQTYIFIHRSGDI